MEKDWIVEFYCENNEPNYKITAIGHILPENKPFVWRLPNLDDERYDLSAAEKITRTQMTALLQTGGI